MPAWEQQLYEAAKKEKQFTFYTAHYNTEEAARLCEAFEKKYAGVKCNFVRTTAQVAFQRSSRTCKPMSRWPPCSAARHEPFIRI